MRYARSRLRADPAGRRGDRRRSSGCSGCSEGQSQEQAGGRRSRPADFEGDARERRRRVEACRSNYGGFGEDAVGMEGNQELIAGLALEAREAGPRKWIRISVVSFALGNVEDDYRPNATGGDALPADDSAL